jgi:hypothetical protein
VGWISLEQNWKKILGSLEMPYEEMNKKKCSLRCSPITLAQIEEKRKTHPPTHPPTLVTTFFPSYLFPSYSGGAFTLHDKVSVK